MESFINTEDYSKTQGDADEKNAKRHTAPPAACACVVRAAIAVRTFVSIAVALFSSPNDEYNGHQNSSTAKDTYGNEKFDSMDNRMDTNDHHCP